MIWEEIAPLSEGRGIFDGIDVIDGKIQLIEFYVYVTRNECDIVRDRNIKIMSKFRNKFLVPKINIGRSFAESLSMKDFFNSTTKEFSKDRMTSSSGGYFSDASGGAFISVEEHCIIFF